jgi:hypothetical protein
MSENNSFPSLTLFGCVMFSCSTYIIKIIRAANGQQKAAKILVPKPRLGA